MTFLPIVRRELQRAARSRGIYRWRTLAALFGANGSALIMLLARPGQGGRTFFTIVFVLADLYCLWEGVRGAADAISQEKRERTLGLLFLTDLQGYDVVLGKAAGVLLRIVQALFSIFPVMATALIMGGVTMGEFWRATLVLCNTLFFSVATGLLVSTLSSESHRAAATAITSLGALVLLPIAVSRFFRPAIQISPWFGVMNVEDAAFDAVKFGSNQVLIQVISWVFLIVASIITGRVWREGKRPSAVTVSPERWSSAEQAEFRRRLLKSSPFCWLIARQAAPGRSRSLLPLLVLAAAGAAFLTGAISPRFGENILFYLALALKLWMAFKASEVFATERKSGTLELIAGSPLSSRDIVRGSWLGLIQLLMTPVVAAGVLHSAAVLTREVYHFDHGDPGAMPLSLWLFAGPAGTALSFWTQLVVDLLAVGWLGLWMGLCSRNSINALAKTALIGVFVPEILFIIPTVIIDLLILVVARQELQQDFHRFALGWTAREDKAREEITETPG